MAAQPSPNYLLTLGYSDATCQTLAQVSYDESSYIFPASCPQVVPPCEFSLAGLRINRTCSSSDLSSTVNALFRGLQSEYLLVEQFSDVECTKKQSATAVAFGFCSPNSLGFSAQFVRNGSEVTGSIYTPMGDCTGTPVATVAVDDSCKSLQGAVSFKIAVKTVGPSRR